MKAASAVFSQYEEHNEPTAFQLPQKKEDLLIIPCFQWKIKFPTYKLCPGRNMADATFTEEEATATLACFLFWSSF